MSNSTPAMLVDYEYCLGCLDCEVACMIERGVGPDKMGIKVMKLGPWRTEDGSWQYDFVPIPTDWCDACAGRVKSGGQAACVRHCSYSIISCGEADELADLVKAKQKMSLFILRKR